MVHRPVDLNLFAFHFPVTAIVSILHRITGVVLFIGLPVMIWAWQLSLQDEAGFSFISSLMQNLEVRLFLWLYIMCLIYHSLAGIRHLLMDLGLGETLPFARYIAWLLFSLVLVIAIILFWYLVLVG